MLGKKPILSRRPCPQCGGAIFYVATFRTMFSGFRKRICEDCGYINSVRVKIVAESAQVF